MSISIGDYVCNLIAGRSIIGHLYDAIDRVNDINSRCGCFCFTFTLKGIGKKTFRENELIKLDKESRCKSISQVFSEAINNRLSIDQAVLLLLIGKNTIRGLYQAYHKASFMRSTGRIYCYTFKNPYGIYAGVNRDCIKYDSQELIDKFCQCNKQPFTPIDIWNGFYGVF